jgi:hypothetical protein
MAIGVFYYIERFNLRKLNKVKSEEQYPVEI